MLRLRKYETSGPKILLDVQSQKSRGLTQKIRALDGHCFDSKYFEKSATHLITDVIRCNEKFLGACVRGLWVLSPKYVEDSCKVGMWLQEEHYERSLLCEHRSFALVAAAQRWRRRIANDGLQPFTGFQVALLLRSHSVYYERLLIYGGAQVFKLSLPLRDDTNVSQILYVFMDSSYKDHVQTLEEYGLLCLDYTYIVDTIIKDEVLDILEYRVRGDSNTSSLLHRSLSCFRGQKSVSIGYVDHSSQTSIESIKVMDGVYHVDLSVDESAAENPQVRILKPKGSRVTLLTISPSPCISQNATGPVNVTTKRGLSRPRHGHAHLKNVTNLCTKENALVESKDHVFPGSQRPCDVRLDIRKANVQKCRFKEFNHPVVVGQHIHKASIIESKTSSTDKGPDLSLDTVLCKTQNNSLETMKICIKDNEEMYTKTEVLSSLTKQQTAIKNLESKESNKKSSEANNSLIHISELKYRLNPSINLYPNDDGALSSATSMTDTAPEQLCKQNRHEKIIKRNTVSCSQRGLKIKPVKKSGQHQVINVCLSQKKLHHRVKRSLPLVQVNIQLHDCQAGVLHSPRITIDGEGLSQTDSTSEVDTEWENADVNSQYFSSSVVNQPDMHTAAHVDASSVTNTRLSSKSAGTSGRQNSDHKSESTSGRQNSDHKSESTSGRQNSDHKSGSTSGRQNSDHKSGSTSGRQNSDHKSGSTSGRQNSDNKSEGTSGRQNSDHKYGGTSDRQGNEDKSGGIAGTQDNENQHRSLWTNVIYIDDDDDDHDDTSDVKKIELSSVNPSSSSVKPIVSMNRSQLSKYSSEASRQDSEDKHRSLWTDIICVDDGLSEVKKSELGSSDTSPSPSETTVGVGSLQLTTVSLEARRQDSGGTSGSISGRQDIENKHRNLWANIIYVEDDTSDGEDSESSALDPSLSLVEPTVSMARSQLSEYSPETSSTSDGQDNRVKSGRQDIEDKSESASGRQANEDKQRSLWADIICVDDDLSEVKQSELSPVDPSLSPTEATVTMERLQLSKSSPTASCPESPSLSEMHRFNPLAVTSPLSQSDIKFSVTPPVSQSDIKFSVTPPVSQSDIKLSVTPPVSQSDIKLSPARLSMMGKNFQARLQSFGFSSVSRKGKDTESKERLSGSKAVPAVSSLKGIGKRKAVGAASETTLKPHTARGLAKRRVLDTTVSHVGTTANECPKWSSDKREEESSLVVEGTQSAAHDSASTTVSGCITLCNPSAQSQPSSTDLSPHITVCNPSAQSQPSSTDLSPHITVCNPSAQSQPSSTDLSPHTQRGLAKRRAVDDSVVVCESKVPKSPSASNDDVTSPVNRDAVVDVCVRNKSVHGSSTKNDYHQAKQSLCKSLSWGIQLPNQTRNTQRGLAKKKTSVPQIQGTNPSSCLRCPAGGHDQDKICAAAKDLQPVICDDSDSSPDNPYSQIICPSSQFSSSCGQTAKGGTHTFISQSTMRSTDSGHVSRQLKTEQFTHSSCSVIDAGMTADSLNAIKSQKETVPILKFDNLQNSAQEYSSPDRSLFESFSKHFSGISSEMSCSDDVHLKEVTSELGSGAELTVSADVHLNSRVRKSTDIQELNLLKKENVGVNIATTVDIIDDYIDLPTPPSVICHDSDAQVDEESTAVGTTNAAVSGELSLAHNPSVVGECVQDEVQPQEESQRKVYDNKHVEPGTSEPHPVWPLTYLVSSSIHPSDTKPFLPVLHGQWMESSREMGFYDQAIAHAKPSKSRLPTSLLLSELVQLARSTDGVVCPQAITYLYTWLQLHPPLTPVTVRLYTEAFELSSESSVVFDILKDIMDESKQSSAILLLEYFISLFEINFDFSLRSGNKMCLQNSLIVKWLWRNSYTIVHGSDTRRLLQLLEHIIRAPILNCRACSAACALLSLACECLRLASVRWDQRNPKFIIDSVITLSRDIAKRIHASFTTGHKSRCVVLNMLRPAWLRILVAAILLSFYNDYLLSDAIHVNEISMNNIVSQFFFLVPLESGGSSDAQDRVKHNCSVVRTSNPSEETFDTKQIKGQKGILTAEKVNKRNGKGESAIHIACMKNKAADLAKLLAVPGADVNLRDNIGWTPLHEACHHGSVSCVELLLKHVPRAPVGASADQEQTPGKVEIDAQGLDGVTPFQDAVGRNKIDVCKLMLRYGGKKLLKSKTHYNYTAIDFVRSDEMSAVLNSFSEASSLFDLSISQDVDDPAMIIDTVKDTAPLTQRYKEVTGVDCGHLTSRSSCEEFLMLLTVLVSSYYSILGSLEKSNQIDLKNKDVLRNMNLHLMLFKRHLRKLTRPEDFDKLQFRLECFESLCIYKPEKTYL